MAIELRTDIVQDRHREFNQTMREFSYLRTCRRFGIRPQANMPFGMAAVYCPACPQPGKNMRPGWQLRDVLFRYEACDVLGGTF